MKDNDCNQKKNRLFCFVNFWVHFILPDEQQKSKQILSQVLHIDMDLVGLSFSNSSKCSNVSQQQRENYLHYLTAFIIRRKGLLCAKYLILLPEFAPLSNKQNLTELLKESCLHYCK